MTLEQRVIKTLKDNLEKSPEISLESRLLEDLLVDSLDRMMLLSGLEDEFSITIAEEDFAEVATVSDIVRKLKARLSD
ncbi:MAG: acyl carrier protein [Firmicutes bacterium HGW-Firmicutes-12]|nr:MAG: acyl carrier protein [Firmicutes bacterium HGW-Firmicutes-12]